MPAPAHRVLVVGIDGVRLDTLNRLPTPHLDTLAAEGFLRPVEVDAQTPTMSGPCWATVVTGVTVARHGVWSNDFTGHRLDVFPDFATRLTAQGGLRTFVAAGWQPLMQAHAGGPLFAAPSRSVYISPTEDTPEAWEHCDEQITDAAVRLLADPADDTAASFVYLGAPDETAHFLGCGEPYEAAIRRADARLGRLLEAVRSRPSYPDEQWTVLVVTDHGHVDAGGHGGRTETERTAWLAAAGPGIGAPARGLRHVDVAAQVFAALGRHPDRHWTLDGTPFAAAPHAVLLDMDGTLVDTESLWLRTVREAVPGIEPDALFPALDRSAADTAALLHPEDPHTLAADLEDRFFAAIQREAAPLPGALELLDLLQGLGIPAALVSASSRPVVDAVLKTLGHDRFRATVAEGETPRTKPAADPYLAAARALGVDPAACLAVEDSPTGVTAAEAAGCRVLAVPSYTPIEPGPRCTVRRRLAGIGRRELWAAGL
ncbi:type I phosphodiesterase/nucleotide pyrophosphatase [Streptomyces davaonensis JCM 4913]|uniref:Type I phosphodiesterase/nucleotide pyrophosphatase n=1 Tax=Streptomyces davaonensis (strain DSM 101723 / JCM 4913 / KCC S-0913 / 768) TaxID=1214101 RepID=K4QWF5_STRDJ|nr:HAD-IA family hydrolase [Streptomyces davaonensis]CCK25343.1 type I phosphodiesterase/nucleotide pyrophosphatase [Streptomyces davaonensis JCM 4913]